MTAAVDRMRHHLAEFDAWQTRITDHEDRALAELRPQLDRRTRRGKAPNVEYALACQLRDDLAYQQACSKRNGHQKAAIMFGIAALLERGGAA